MPSVNKVFILGALGRDPETRFTSTNLQITSFSVATSTFRKGEDGERKEETEWHRITTIGRTAEVAQTYLSKGSKVFIEGHLRTRKWENKEGKTQYSTEIVADNLQLLDKKSDRPGQPGQAKQAPAEEPYLNPCRQIILGHAVLYSQLTNHVAADIFLSLIIVNLHVCKLPDMW